MNNEPANPFGPGFQVTPINPTQAPALAAGKATFYQFALAALVLYLIMRYVPKGEYIGAAILAGALLTSPGAVKGFADMLDFVQNPRLS